MSVQGEITHLLIQLRNGDAKAEERLLETVYGELKRIARARLREFRRGQTLQPTALVNEAYMKIAPASRDWENRKHFYRVATRAMRQIVVDHAREQMAQKRGGDLPILPIDESALTARQTPSDIIALNEALEQLQRQDPQVYRVVELRFFGGLSVEETAATMGISARTVKREWRLGRAWLRAALEGGERGRASAVGQG